MISRRLTAFREPTEYLVISFGVADGIPSSPAHGAGNFNPLPRDASNEESMQRLFLPIFGTSQSLVLRTIRMGLSDMDTYRISKGHKKGSGVDCATIKYKKNENETYPLEQDTKENCSQFVMSSRVHIATTREGVLSYARLSP